MSNSTATATGTATAGASSTGSTSSAPAAEAVDQLTDPDVKIILLGDSAVGKSKLVERFLMNNFIPRQMSTYALTVFRYQHDNSASAASANANAAAAGVTSSSTAAKPKVQIDFWDTAGQERFSSMHPSYYHRCHCCILVFDCTRKITYQHLEDWYKELQNYRPGLPTLIVANKIDIDYNVVKKQFGFPAKHEHCAPSIYFTSAADGTNVVKLFTDAIQFAIRYKDNPDEADFTEEVMSVIDYFDQKEKAKSSDE